FNTCMFRLSTHFLYFYLLLHFSDSSLHLPHFHPFPPRRSSDLGVAAMSDPLSAAGQVALVTGASRGIGRAIALALASRGFRGRADRKSTRLNSSHVEISYAVFCLKKKKVEKICSHRL